MVWTRRTLWRPFCSNAWGTSSALWVLGDWLDGSSWMNLLDSARAIRVAESLLKVSHVTRLDWPTILLQLHVLLQQMAFSKRQNKEKTFEAWCKTWTEKQLMLTSTYWSLALLLELSVFQVVHSIWTVCANADQSSDLVFCHGLYTLHRQHFVHLHDLCQLIKKHPSVHQAFYPGTFVINKTWWPSSAIASDHVHALCNSMVKYGLTTNPAALCRWI